MLAACAPVEVKPQASSEPASQPTGRTFNPVNPKDPTQGYFVTFDAAKALLERSYSKEQAIGVAKLDCDEQVQLTKDSQPVSAWNLWIKPALVGAAALVVGGLVGAGAEALKK
jgi:hypothetical protein